MKKKFYVLLIVVALFIMCSCSMEELGRISESTVSGETDSQFHSAPEFNPESASEPILDSTPQPTAEPTPEPTTEPTEAPTPQPTESPQSTKSPQPTETPMTDDEDRDAFVEKMLSEMSMEDKISQMFMLRLESESGEVFTEPTDDLIDFSQRNIPGGYVLFGNNITDQAGTKALVDTVVENSKYPPFMGIDEEGGVVTRLGEAKFPGYTPTAPAADIGATGDPENAYQAGNTIGSALKSIGINLDFAPDADVLTNPKNTVIGNRSFGSDPELVSDMLSAFQRGLHDNGIMTAPKHFPGHGGTSGDSHLGFVSIDYDEKHLNSVEYKPFERAISEGTEFILVGHINAPNADKSGLPASLSSYFVTDTLRNQLGFDGIIITDAMDMGAIIDNYGIGDSAVMAISAGVDIVLMPKSYEEALEGVTAAIASGDITEKRIDESVSRILRAKFNAGLFSDKK